jgi:hypothetical protein
VFRTRHHKGHRLVEWLSNNIVYHQRGRKRRCYFLELPQEIRDEIYCFVFSDRICGYKAISLLRVCKQLHHEARKLIIEKVAVRMSSPKFTNAIQRNWLETAKHFYLRDFHPRDLHHYGMLRRRTDVRTLTVQIHGWVYVRGLNAEKSNQKIEEWQWAIAQLLEARPAQEITLHVADLWPIVTARSRAYSATHYPYKVAVWAEVEKGSLQALSQYGSKWWWWTVRWSVLTDQHNNRNLVAHRKAE